MAARTYGQYCGITTALELIGERWALLIIRDLLVGPKRYGDLKQGLPRIPTNILAKRLKELQQAGVIRRAPMARCGIVYELTELGRSLEPMLLELGRWGFRSMGEPQPDDIVTPDSITMALRTAFVPQVAAGLPDTDYELHVGPVAVVARVAGAVLQVAPVSSATPARDAAGNAEVDLVIVAGPGIRKLISGEVDPGTALASELVSVQAGDSALLDRFAATFHIDPHTG